MAVANIGVRLHDVGEGDVSWRLQRASDLGFSCIQLPSKVLYASYGIDWHGLTREFALRLRKELAERGLRVSVFGCYKNLVHPNREQRADILEEYRASLMFAHWLGASAVGTETGRPNAANRITPERFSDEALHDFAHSVARVCTMAEQLDMQLLIEPGWNEVVCSPERAHTVLDEVTSPALGIIYDPVSLLHPQIASQAQRQTARMIELCGKSIRLLHAKDFEIVNNEDADGWCDGTGRRLVCYGAGVTGAYDFAQLAQWVRHEHRGIDVIIENGTPQTLPRCREYLLRTFA